MRPHARTVYCSESDRPPAVGLGTALHAADLASTPKIPPIDQRWPWRHLLHLEHRRRRQAYCNVRDTGEAYNAVRHEERPR